MVESYTRYNLVTAYGDPSRPLATMRAFLVPNDAPGFAVGRLEHKLGQRLSSAKILGEDANDPTWGRREMPA